MELLELNGETFAADADWVNFDKAELSEDEVRREADGLGAALVCCVSKDRATALGCARGSNLAPGTPSLAAALAESEPRFAWCGVFAVENGWVVLATREGLPYPTADKVFEGADQARTLLDTLTARGIFERVYAPSDWEMPGTRDTELTAMLKEGTRRSFGHPKKTIGEKTAIFGQAVWKRKWLVGSALLLLIGVPVGWSKYEAYKVQQAQERATLAAQQAAEARRLAEEKKARRRQERAWHLVSKPGPLVANCLAELASLRRPVAGWQPQQAGCRNGTVESRWQKEDFGRVAYFQEVMTERNAHFTVDNNGGAVTTMDWPTGDIRGPHELWKIRDARLRMIDLAGKYEGRFTNRPGPKGSDITLRDGGVVGREEIVFEGITLPRHFAQALDHIPGLSIETVTSDDGRHWRLEGNLYHEK